MANGSNVANATPTASAAHKYQLVDRNGRTMGGIPLETLLGMIRQGRLFRSDRIAKDGGTVQSLGSLREFAVVFDEVNPATPRFDALRAIPEFAGEADPLSLARAFVRIYRGRHNGRLFVNGNGAREEKVVIFRDGVPVNATSNIKEEWLGEVLRNQGLIDQATFDEAVRASQVDGPRLGEVLVEKDKISARQLYRALAVQAMDRLLKLFQRGGTFHFVLDESTATEEILLLAGPRDVLETCLAASLSPQRVTEILAENGDPTLRVDIPADLAGELNDGDRTVLTILEEGRPLSASLPRIADALRLTTAEARSRVLFLLVFDCLKAGNAGQEALEQMLDDFQGKNFFEILDVRLAATSAEVDEAYEALSAEIADHGQGRNTRAEQQVKNLLDRARKTLNNPELRPLYERALQLGIDFDQPQAKARLRHELLMERGRGLIMQQNYAEALTVLSEAHSVSPNDAATEIELGWAQFLAGARTATTAREAKRRLDRALNLDPSAYRAHLVMGKIARMMGNKAEADAAFKKALALVPGDREVEAEMRGLARGIDERRTRPGVGNRYFDPRALVAIGAAVAVIVLLYVGANVVSGGPELWPETGGHELDVETGQLDPKMIAITQIQRLRLSFPEEKLVEAALRMGADKATTKNKSHALGFLSTKDYDKVVTMLRSLREIPAEQQTLGSIEFYYDSSDGFWWARRTILLVLGLLFMGLIGRQRLGELPIMGEHTNLLVVAPLYGIIIGMFSVVPPLASTPGATMGMTVYHVLAEQAFFIWFLARTLDANVHLGMIGAALAGVLYGFYQLTYTATLAQPTEDIVIQLLQFTIFVGGAYALLAWRTRGILAPLLAHLTVNGTMMVRAML